MKRIIYLFLLMGIVTNIKPSVCTLTQAAEDLIKAKWTKENPDAGHPRGWYAGNNGTCINCNNYVKPQCLRCSSPNHKWANCTITKIYFP